MDGGPDNLTWGEIVADLDDVAVGFRLGGSKAVGEEVGLGGALELFGIESGQAAGRGDCAFQLPLTVHMPILKTIEIKAQLPT